MKFLDSELDCRHLNTIATTEIPALWAKLHDLRQALQMLRAAAAPDNPAEVATQHPDRLASLEKLQRAWTDRSAERLRAQAAEVEMLVSKAIQAASGGEWRSQVKEGA